MDFEVVREYMLKEMPNSCKGIFNDAVVLVHDVLGTPSLACLDGDGHTVLIGTADEQHFLSP